ncbi:cytochrome ubiquinol oxidase subunit I [Nocardia sp. NPDC051787]|uniref:cytochrome ubiquinol oxidase subunit I n=1 Tax=Nocardia sp. NPDC051787 TaxID=3155415 RepID=UPI003427463F
MVSSTLTAVYSASGEGPPGLLPARQQMAFSLGWHIVLACFGIAFPAMIYVVHCRGITRHDPVALGLAKRWATVSAILFAIGAVSGTAVVALAAVTVLPALAYLFWLTQTDEWVRDQTAHRADSSTA